MQSAAPVEEPFEVIENPAATKLTTQPLEVPDVAPPPPKQADPPVQAQRTMRAPLQFRQPKPVIRRAPDYGAAEQLDEVLATQEQAKRNLVDSELAAYQYFIRCFRGHIGAFLTINPTGEIITPGDWYASYRFIEDPWPEEVLCQVCYKCNPETGECMGERVPLQVTYLPSGNRRNIQFIVPAEIAWRYPKNKDRMLAEGVMRAGPVRYQTGNKDWMPSIEQLQKTEQRRREQLALVGESA